MLRVSCCPLTCSHTRRDEKCRKSNIIICTCLNVGKRPWEGRLGDVMCRSGEFAKDISIGVSIFTLVALAADRYNGIVNPLRKLQARSAMVHVTVAFIWILAITFAVPSLLVSEVLMSPNGIQFCSPFGSFGRTYSK